MKKIKNIITIQHPESIHHKNGMVGSWTDWQLSERGKKQAAYIAFNLRNELKDKTYSIYSSPLLRTRETALIIGEYFKTAPIYIDALKERNLGRANGQSVKWLKENLENSEYTIDDKCFSDAESKRDVWERCRPFYRCIVENEEENIIIVSHGELLSIFNVMWLKLDIKFLNIINLYGASGGVSFLHQDNQGKRVIKRMSDMSYLHPF